eukprot:TRINITY_DN30144_c0_g1_i1.p2 TRINITY_DN30144_c0_g1~~TRINITY_DN30144_c0_g1_i1.p2  ORF type:complete len:167 (-),score=27.56 TRINITY_DN30144_c0_g1_i1:76-576(-)
MGLFISLFEGAQIYDQKDPTKLSAMGSKFFSGIRQIIKKIKKSGITPGNIRFLQKIIVNPALQDYNIIFSDPYILDCANAESIGSSDMGIFSFTCNERKNYSVKFEKNSEKCEKYELALQEIKFFSNIIRKYRQVRIFSIEQLYDCLLYTSPSPRDLSTSRMPSSA